MFDSSKVRLYIQLYLAHLARLRWYCALRTAISSCRAARAARSGGGGATGSGSAKCTRMRWPSRLLPGSCATARSAASRSAYVTCAQPAWSCKAANKTAWQGQSPPAEKCMFFSLLVDASPVTKLR